VALSVCVYILRFTLKFAASSDTPPRRLARLWQGFSSAASRAALQGVPGHETDPQADLARRIGRAEANEKLEWIDSLTVSRQIPVKER